MNGKDAYYFSHDANARNDLKISAMISKYGMEGYGRFWVIVEVLRESKEFEIEQKQYAYSALAKQMQCTIEQVQEFVNDCINEFSLLKSDGEKIWSDSLKKRMAAKKEIIEKRRQSANLRWSNAKAMQMQCESNAIKGKERKGKERKEKNKEKNIEKNSAKELLEYLNARTGRKYKNTSEIQKRLSEGHTADECRKIIDTKIMDPYFIENPKYLNPITLFRAIHFDQYLNENPGDYKQIGRRREPAPLIDRSNDEAMFAEMHRIQEGHE
jgi:uncharacterized phage protein (TIGR02220 family)